MAQTSADPAIERHSINDSVPLVLAVFIVGSAAAWLAGWLLGLATGSPVIRYITGHGVLSGLAAFSLLYGGRMFVSEHHVVARQALLVSSMGVALLMLSGLWTAMTSAVPAPLDQAFPGAATTVYRILGAFCLLLSLQSWLVIRRPSTASWVWMPTLTAVLVASLALYFIGRSLVGLMAPHTLGGQIILLLLLSGGALTPPGPRHDRPYLALPVALGGVLAGSALWYVLMVGATANAADRAQNTAVQAALLLEEYASSRLTALGRLADRIAALEPALAGAVWSVDTESYFRDMPALSALAFVNPNGQVVHSALRPGAGLREMRDLQTRLQNALASARRPVYAFPGPDRLLTEVPPSSPESTFRLIVQIAPSQLVSRLYEPFLESTWEGIPVLVDMDRYRLLDNNGATSPALQDMGSQKAINLLNPGLTISTLPSNQTVHEETAISPNWLYVIVLSTTLLLATGSQVMTTRKRIADLVGQRAVEMGFALDTLTDPVILLDANHRVRYMNAAWHRLFPGHGGQQSTLQQLLPTLAAQLPEDMAEHCRDGPWEGRFHLEETGRWMDARLYHQGDTSTLHLRDITALKNTHASLQQALAELRRSQQIAAIGSWRMDVGSQRIDWPQPTRAIMQVPPDLDRSPVDVDEYLSLIHPDDVYDVARAQQRVIRTGLNTDLTFRIVAGDQAIRWIRQRMEMQTTTDGDPQLIGLLQDITELRESAQALEFSESHDLLTGLVNRAELDRRIQAAIMLARHTNRVSAALYIDIDQFKPINDSLGHPTGDRLLKQVAKRLGELVRSGDTVARVGGDEFVIFLNDLGAGQDAHSFAERVLASFDEPFLLDGRGQMFLTCSIGISMLAPGDEETRNLVQEADVAMSEAKKAGSNTTFTYVPGLEAEKKRHTTLRSQLRDALQRHEFHLVYQPQIDTLNGRVSGFEALLRWRHPELGELSPAEFIPVAEQSGMIVEIGRWVLQEACRFNLTLIRERLCDVPVAVNISGLQFVRPGFVEEVFGVLEDTGLPANRLELEITESSMMVDAVLTTEKLQALGDAGIGLAVDDFGTGYSSLSYLRDFPIKKLKIDKSFVDHVTEKSGDAGIVLATISMAHHLGMTVVAEGVERESQANFLRRHQCEHLQGYYFARPLSPEALIEYFKIGDQHMGRSQHQDVPVRTVLIVDDEPNILRALSRTLRREGYRVLQADSAREAMELLASDEVQVIISDQRMPEMSGTEFLSHVKEIYPDVVRIILSGYTELSAVTDAINRGAIYRFLTKPWEDDQLRENIREAFRKYERDTNAQE